VEHAQGKLDESEAQLAAMVEKYPDATLLEYCEYWGTTYNQWVSTSTMCRALQKQKLTLKKKTLRSSQAQTERIQKLRSEYWQQVQQIDPVNLVFIDEMGVLLGLTRTHARSFHFHGSRVYDFKPFYRGVAIRLSKVGQPSTKSPRYVTNKPKTRLTNFGQDSSRGKDYSNWGN